MNMKRNVKGNLLLMSLFIVGNIMAGNPTIKNSSEPKSTPKMEANVTNSAVKSHRILVLGMQDNVKSNYFATSMLAEDTQINPDSVCYIYNRVIENNLSQLAKKSKAAYTFIDGYALKGMGEEILNDVKTSGEAENQASDLTLVSETRLKRLLDKAGADYLLLLDTHYLKYQEVPFKTIFHYVNYSLYNGEKQKLTQGSNYFTSINPQSEKQMLKSSRKSTAKMLDNVENTLSQR